MWRLVGVVALLMGVCSAEPSMWVEGAKPDEAVTPYFAHYAFPLLIENINLDLALDQYRTCWGWALGGGRTTWVEVFDTRWTHCHQWAGCPTWQLTRYVFGLNPRFDIAPGHYEFNLSVGSLKEASGKIPMPGGGVIGVKWNRTGDGPVNFEIECPSPITLSVNTWDGGENLQIKGTNLLTFSHDLNAGWILTDRSNSSARSTPQPDSADVQSGATKTQPVERP